LKCDESLCGWGKINSNLTEPYFYLAKNAQRAYCPDPECFPPQRNKSLLKIKPCFGCGDAFIDYGNNYDYCADCAINDNHYVPDRFSQSKCSECGDDSGRIKINQELRVCKLCQLTKGVSHE